MTVVEMSRSASPVAEPVHDRLLVLRPHPAVQQLHAEVGEDLGGQALGLGLGGLHLRRFPSSIAAQTTNACRPASTSVERGRRRARARSAVRTRARLDRLAPLRHLVQHDDVQVAVVGERQRPRDGRRRHDQDVRLAALALQRHPLMQPERCCSSTTASERSGNVTPSWTSAWVPTDEIDVRRRRCPARSRARSLPVTAAVRSA